MDSYFEQILYEVIRSLGSRNTRQDRICAALLSLQKYVGPTPTPNATLSQEFNSLIDALPDGEDLRERLSQLSENELDDISDWLAGWVFSHKWEE